MKSKWFSVKHSVVGFYYSRCVLDLIRLNWENVNFASASAVKQKLWVPADSNHSKGAGFTTSQLPCWSMETAPLLHIWAFDIAYKDTARSHFPLSYPLLLGGQRHVWRSVFPEDYRSPIKSFNLTQCMDLNPWCSDHKNYALADCATNSLVQFIHGLNYKITCTWLNKLPGWPNKNILLYQIIMPF